MSEVWWYGAVPTLSRYGESVWHRVRSCRQNEARLCILRRLAAMSALQRHRHLQSVSLNMHATAAHNSSGIAELYAATVDCTASHRRYLHDILITIPTRKYNDDQERLCALDRFGILLRSTQTT